MTDLRDRIDTVVLVMMENRSFDHMLGHLTYERLVSDVRGLQRPLRQYDNLYKGDLYPVWRRLRDTILACDVPHEHGEVAVQLALSPVTQQFTMAGFVEAYANYSATKGVAMPSTRAEPMGIFPSSLVPISSFLARNFAPCDSWFSSLPTSTQPNRTIAFCGDSSIIDTKPRLIQCDDILFDWMDRNNVRWRVYHDGLSFFALYPRAMDRVLGDDFREFEFLHLDLSTAPAATDPQVIIVEPSYESAPHLGPDQPNDNHAPLAVAWGEEFLRRTYDAVRSNPERWARTVMILYYDEHGGFWDHVPPPMIPYTPPGATVPVFNSLGPRIPATIVSPLVPAGEATHALFDHTSVLQFLAGIFSPGTPYNATVELRRNAGIKSLAEALTLNAPRTDAPPAPAVPIQAQSALGQSIDAAPADTMAAAFEMAANALMEQYPLQVASKYPELFQWKAAVDAIRV